MRGHWVTSGLRKLNKHYKTTNRKENINEKSRSITEMCYH